MAELPSITLVTPSFNQAEYIEETIDSVLSQGYPRLEFIIIDGGSQDGSVEIIRKYEKHLAFWVSEKDRGQSDAINKGFLRATGEVFNWLCSDDTLEPGALRIVGEAFAGVERPDVVVGGCRMHLPDGPLVIRPERGCLDLLPFGNPIPQPSCFFRKSLIATESLVREDLHYVMDLELWTRLKNLTSRWTFCNQVLSYYRTTDTNKTSTGAMKIVREHDRLCRELDRRIVPLSAAYANSQFLINRLRARCSSRLFWKLTSPLFRASGFGLNSFYGRSQVKALSDFWFTFLWPEWSGAAKDRGKRMVESQ